MPELADVYKLIYDGLGARDESVRDVCIRYLSLNFKMFREDEENAKNKLEEED